MQELLVGVDVGGSKVAAGLVSVQGEILYATRLPMDLTSAASALASVVCATQAALEQSRQRHSAPQQIGLCVPGPLALDRGILLNPPNLPCWRNFPLVEELQQRLGIAVRWENDANAAALAEARWGAGAGCRHLFYATLGTGIGTGVVVDGKIFHGSAGFAVEAGHLSLDRAGPRCGCGKRGCVEALCAAPAIARRAEQKLSAGGYEDSLLRHRPTPLTSEEVARAFRLGDRLARDVVGETMEWLGMWLGEVMDLFDPEVIVVGGGLSELAAACLAQLREVAARWTINPRAAQIPLRRAHYGADAGLAGAAALLLQPS